MATPRLSFRIPEDLRVQIDRIAAERDTNVTQVVRTALKEYVKSYNNPPVAVSPSILSSVKKDTAPFINHPVVRTLKSEGITVYDDSGNVLTVLRDVKSLLDYIQSRQI